MAIEKYVVCFNILISILFAFNVLPRQATISHVTNRNSPFNRQVIEHIGATDSKSEVSYSKENLIRSLIHKTSYPNLKPRLLNNRNILKRQTEIHPHERKPIRISIYSSHRDPTNLPITTKKGFFLPLGIPHPKPRRAIGSFIKSNLRISCQSLLEFWARCRSQDLLGFRFGVLIAL